MGMQMEMEMGMECDKAQQQQRSLNAFWKHIPEPALEPEERGGIALPREEMGNVVCEDCDAGMEGMIEGEEMLEEYRCAGCSRVVCAMCAVVGEGGRRRCLECACVRRG